jgi:hypothetical protein
MGGFTTHTNTFKQFTDKHFINPFLEKLAGWQPVRSTGEAGSYS